MFSQKTTFVIGAGASCELGLPSGDKLKEMIFGILSPTNDNIYGFSNETLVRLIQSNYDVASRIDQIEIQGLKEAAGRIRKGLPLAVSIDNFLHTHFDDEKVIYLGKTAIAIAISQSEAESSLFAPPDYLAQWNETPYLPHLTTSNAALRNSWYPAFAQLLMSGIQRQDIHTLFNSVKFIVFNYDRCFEQFLCMAIQEYFDLDEGSVAEVMHNATFIHPYGSLGPLPWQSDNGPVPLGGASIRDLNRMPSRIRTFTESVKSNISLRIKETVEWSTTLVFLGFGFLQQNIQLLYQPSETRGSRALTTAFGVSHPDQDVIRDTLMMLGRVDFRDAFIEPGSCSDLFANYRLHLSLR